MNKTELHVVDGYYHCFNRGVDKRVVYQDDQDFDYFLKALELFNREDSLGGMMEYQYPKNVIDQNSEKVKKLVNVCAFCLNPNHYHLILQPNTDNGVQKFMQKVNTGYTMYFNKKNKRSGSLFQGRYKSAHINSDEYLRHVLTYVSLNNKVHSGIGHKDFRSNLSCGGKYKNVFDDTLIIDLFGTLKKFEYFARARLSFMREVKRRLEEGNSKDDLTGYFE